MTRLRICLLSLCLSLASALAWAQLTETTTAVKRVQVPPSSATSWTDILVGCPTGLVALSGGVDTNAFNIVDVTTLAPTFGGAVLAFQPDGTRGPADGWYASVKNYDTVDHVVAVAVTCAALPGAVVSIASANVVGGTAAAPGSGGAVAVCPAGYSGLGGGVDVSGPAAMKLSSSSPVFGAQFLIDRASGQGSAPTGWTGNIRNEGGAGTVKVAVVCAQLSGVLSVATAAFAVDPRTVGGASALCPAGTIVLGGGVDSNDLVGNAISVSTPMFDGPQFPADRASGSYASAAGWYAIVFNYGGAAATARVGAVCAPVTAGITLVYEFYNSGLKHYFRTSSAAEAAGIDSGAAGPNWVRTGDNFHAYTPGSSAPGSDVCRFYTFGANSHFYTAFDSECAGLKSPNSGWVYEGLSFRIPLPAAGNCAAGTLPVYRLYNNRFAFNDSNHRFTTIAGEVAALQAQGWTYEGVAFCAPGV